MQPVNLFSWEQLFVSPAAECLEEVWKGDAGVKQEVSSEETEENEGTTHNAREL